MSRNNPGLGIEYEVLLPAHFSLILFENDLIDDFQIESNVKGFGKWDDVLIYVKLKSGEEQYFAFQLKHSESDNKKLLPTSFTTDKSFLISEYCKSFKNLKPQDRIKYHAILYTNRGFDNNRTNEVKEFDMEENKNCPGQILFDTYSQQNEVNHIYKFQVKNNQDETSKDCSNGDRIRNQDENCKRDELSTEDFVKFFEKFSLYVSQTNSKGLEANIVSHFKEKYSAKTSIATNYVDFFRKWHKSEFADMKITREIVQIQLFNLLTENANLSYTLFKSNEEILESAIDNFDITLVENINGYEIEKNDQHKEIIHRARLLKLLPKVCKEALYDEEYYKILQLLGKKPLILDYSLSNSKLIRAALKIWATNKDKIPVKLILSGKQIDKSELESNFCIFNTLYDLYVKNISLYGKLLEESKMCLQGRGVIKMAQIVDETVSKLIKTDWLFESLKGPLNIGEQAKKINTDYIPRVVIASTVHFSDIVLIENDWIVIDCESIADTEEIKRKLEQDTTQKVSLSSEFNEKDEDIKDKSAIILTNGVQEFKTFLENEWKNIHFFKYLKTDNFQWLRTQGSTESLQKVTSPKIKMNENLVFDHFLNDVNAICAVPGMGKSIFIDHLYNNCPSDYWAIKINLRDFNITLKDKNSGHKQDEDNRDNKAKFEDILNSYFVDTQDIESKTKEILRKNKKIFFFLDAFDELNSTLADTAIEFMQYLRQSGFKIWISSRKNYENKLKKSFNLFPLEIESLSEECKSNYIRKRLQTHYSQDKVDLIVHKIVENQQFFKSADILGVPLQLFMLTELFIQDKKLVDTFDENIFVMTEMYEKFLEAKIDHYVEKVAKMNSFEDVKKDNMQTRRSFEVAALASCLDDDFFDSLKITDNWDQIKENFTGTGIIAEMNEGKPKFEHTTQAEYLAACYLVEHLSKNKSNSDKIRLIFNKKYDMIRLMFDIKLAEKSEPHLRIIYGDFERFKTLTKIDSIDKGGRTVLHLACSYGAKIEIQQSERDVNTKESSNNIDKEKMEINGQFLEWILNNSNISIDVKDTIFEFDALQYADATNNLQAIDKILPKKQNKSKIIKTLPYYKKNLACLIFLGAQFNFINVLKMIHHLTKSFTLHPLKAIEYRKVKSYKSTQNETPLHIAIENCNIDAVRLLLDQGIPINTIDAYKRTPLDTAILIVHEEIQTLLIGRGAKKYSSAKYEKHPLQYAARKNYTKIVEILIDNRKIDIDSGDTNNWTALHHAAYHGNVDVMKFLIERDADIDAKTHFGETPLYLSTYNGKEQAATLLINKDANINAVNDSGISIVECAIKKHRNTILKPLLKRNNVDLKMTNLLNETPLHIAAKYNNVEAVNKLIRYDIDIESRNNFNETALFYAAATNLKILKILQDKGADLKIINDLGETILHNAAQSENIEVIKYLIDNNFDITITNNNGDTALNCAIINNKPKSLEILLKSSPQSLLSHYNHDGLLPIHLAIQHNNLACFNMLLNKGSNIEDQTLNDKSTPLFLAVEEDNLYAVQFLLDKNANIFARRENGETMIHRAVLNCNFEIVSMLIERNINVCNMVDQDFITPLMLSVKLQNYEMLKMLISSNADIEGDLRCSEKPLEVAKNNGNEDIVKLLESALSKRIGQIKLFMDSTIELDNEEEA